jgi:hypothetical protein
MNRKELYSTAFCFCFFRLGFFFVINISDCWKKKVIFLPFTQSWSLDGGLVLHIFLIATDAVIIAKYRYRTHVMRSWLKKVICCL